MPSPSEPRPAGTTARTVKRYLPWVVATALFMEQLDSTIVNTGDSVDGGEPAASRR